MAESFITRLKQQMETGGLDEGKKEKGSTISLLIPWSCREGFTNEVCGLPGLEDGCWRNRETASNRNINIKDKGIQPGSVEDIGEPLIAWIVFESPAEGGEIIIECEVSKPPYKDSHHQAFFGFTKEGLDAFRSQSESGYYPNYVEYSGVLDESEGKINIKNWLRNKNDKTDKLGLSDCFGQATFRPQEIKSEELKLNLKLSLSDLIRKYLNHNRGCDFRRDEAARGVGITICKVGVELSKTPIVKRGSEETDETKSEDLLNTCAISFSYVDTETLTIRKLPQWCIGKHDCDIHEYNSLKSVSDKYFVPLHVRRFSDQPDSIAVNFATCLSRYGRQHVLPSEVGKSFLNFPVGEISSYLLHWLLLRIFAEDSQQNIAFIEAFSEWRKLVEDDAPAHSQSFIDLLKKRVTLPVDTNVFREAVTDLTETKEKYLGIYESPTPFGEVLGVLGLSNGQYSTWIHATLEFLRRFFNPSTSDQNFSQLPMYKDLKWESSPLLGRVDGSLSKEARIEAALACVANASGLTTYDNRREIALDELRRHSLRCVFPIADILANLPFEEKMPLYYIFPLWEDTIRDDAGDEWRGPVIFAHVFTRALHSTPDAPLPPDSETIATGEKLQSILLPAGASIAHDYYKKILAQKTAWTAARAWAHEVKNYTSPIIDDLGNSILQKSKIVTSEEAREIIDRSRRGALILNAVSRAVQSSLSNKVSADDVKKSEKEGLQKLKRDHAQEIVEMALQYLLNHYHDFLESSSTVKYIIDWKPRFTTTKILENLAALFGSKDEKNIFSHEQVIGVIALLREVVWNIRNEAPYTTKADEVAVIKISYDFAVNNGRLILSLKQEQFEKEREMEGRVEKNRRETKEELPVGVRLANTLFGKGGAGFGSIKHVKISRVGRGQGLGDEVTYVTPVEFAI